MNLNEILQETVYFGAALSIFFYWIGTLIQKKWKLSILNPLLICLVLVILFLKIFHIDYETYDAGAKYITYFLTPATVCLALPLYRQMQILKKNLPAILISILLGCLAHFFVVWGIAALFHLNDALFLSFLPKSVTTPIALGISDKIGGLQEITVIGVTFAGLMGAILGPALLKLFGIRNPAAQGLALGSASHAVGTSRAVELGEIQAAMSSLAIVVTGILTVIICPLLLSVL